MTFGAQVQKNAGYDCQHPPDEFPIMIFVRHLERPSVFTFHYARDVGEAVGYMVNFRAEAADRGDVFLEVWLDCLKPASRRENLAA